MIKYTLMCLGSLVTRLLPLRAAYAVAKILGGIAYWLFGDVRRIAESNFSVIFGGRLEDQEMKRLGKRLFIHLALNTVDLLRFPFVPCPEGFVRVKGEKLLRELYGAQKGVVLVSPHLGNWEMGGMALVKSGLPIHVVAEPISPRRSLFSKDKIGNLYRRYREKLGMKTIALEGSGMKELKVLKRGGILALVADRDISGTGVEVDFFGMRVKVPRGPAALAVRTGAPIVLGVCVRGQDDRLCAILEQVKYDSQNVHEITQLLVEKMEQYIRSYPDQWFVLQPPWS